MTSRTEEPTPRRQREARRRGEVARSAELSAAAALAGGVAACVACGPGIASGLARAIRRAAAGSAGAAGPDAVGAVREAALEVLRLGALPMLAALVAGALAAAIQVGPCVSAEAIRPRLERLDPVKGLRLIFSPSQLARTALSLAKAAALVAIAAGWLRGAAPALAWLPRAGPGGALRLLPGEVAGLALRLAVCLGAFGVADLALERHRHRLSLRMTRDEVRREAKDDEGDPAHRSERRRVHRALVEASPVARATVVVVNPTRVAVALRHDRERDEAPRVLAKGIGGAAARIRSAARRAGVPVVRDVALARALFRLAEVGDEIPEELYEAAAAVLAHLYGSEEA